jgi:hypothetical protein
MSRSYRSRAGFFSTIRNALTTRAARDRELMTYRYRFTGGWLPVAAEADRLFVMLDPSTADDPTVRKCIGFATRWGAGGLGAVNLHARRATRPADLWTAAYLVGEDNEAILRIELSRAGYVVVAWGNHARHERVARFRELVAEPEPMFQTVWCLGTTAAGRPGHPLYVPYTTEPVQWRP